jgi:phosphatidylinositol alpha-1,6-mannosyltransferase
VRVLLATPFYSPGVGGSSRLLQDIVDYLRVANHEVEVLTYGDAQEATTRGFDRAQAYPIHRIKAQSGAGKSSLAMARAAFSLCKRGKFDVIFTGVAYPTAMMGYLIKRLLGVPFVVYSHGEDVTCARDSKPKAFALRRVLAAASYVMTNSSFSLREARAFGAHGDRSETTPPSIDPAPYDTVDAHVLDDLRARLGVTNKPLILTVARLNPRKGHDVVIRALRTVIDKVPDVQYLIVGKGDPEPLTRLADDEGVRDSVKIVDYVAEQDLSVLFHVCDVHVMVSRWDRIRREVEGFGIVYLEAGASGKPSVAGSAGGCADAVANGETGFVVDPESVEEVSAALLKVLTDPVLAARMGAAGKKRVRELFAKDRVLPRIERILVEHCNPSRR